MDKLRLRLHKPAELELGQSLSKVIRNNLTVLRAYILRMDILLIVIFFQCLRNIDGSPYVDFLSRAEEYKKQAFEKGCGWWVDILRLHFRHENYCEDGLLNTAGDVDDFDFAGVAWITMMEWDNPLLTDRVRNTLLSRLTTMPWWLDESGRNYKT